MAGGSIHQAQFLLILLLVFIVGFGILAQRLKIAYPIVLVLGGLLVSVIPGLPRIALNPDFVFVAVLPPLLFASATQTSWEEFKYNLVSISSLAFGLVAFTVAGVSLAAHWLIPDFDWRVGLVLGAAVAPTDAIAATAIAQRLGLPKRIVDLLEGESLVNDASGLLALQFSTALVVGGSVPTLAGGTLHFLYLTAAGILTGAVVAIVVQWIEARVENTRIEITLSIVTPYLAYALAEAVNASGVLAAVAAGLYLGHKRSSLLSARARVESGSFWNTLTFLLNGIVFLLIGLQLPIVLRGIRSIAPRELAISAAELALSVIALRLAWVVPATYIGSFLRRRVLHQKDDAPSLAETFILGWTGMRGVVSLAAALSLPAVLADGTVFAQRNALIFLTFVTIFVTLVLQGLTLPPLIRFLKLPSTGEHETAERKARRKMIAAAMKRVNELRERGGGEFDSVYDAFGRFYQQRLELLSEESEERDLRNSGRTHGGRAFYVSLAKQLRQAERAALLRMRAQHEISDGLLRGLERELDLADVRLEE